MLGKMDVVVDVGGVYDPSRHQYDHHQSSFTDTFSPEHKTLLSSAGLIYKHFAKEILAGHVEAEYIDLLYRKLYDVFIEPFDAHDNGIAAYPSDIKPRFHRPWDIFAQVNILNPKWNEEDVDVDRRFDKAVTLVKSNFVSVLNYYCNVWLPGRKIMRNNIDGTTISGTDPRLIIINEYCPWSDYISELEEEVGAVGRYMYAIYEDSTKKSWRVHAVPKSPDSFESRKPLPTSWRGLRDGELSHVSGIDDCIFVHRTGFIGGHKTKEGAIQMALKALELN